MVITENVIIAFITGILGPVIIFLLNKRFGKSGRKKDTLKETVKVSELVNEKIDHIRDEFEADRVWIIQFHNGGNYYPTGKSMAKFSMLYETVGAGVSSVQGNYQNIPVNLFSRPITQLLEHDTISIEDLMDENLECFGLRYRSDVCDCKSIYNFAIKSVHDKFIAILGVDFTKKPTSLTSENISHIHTHATSLGGTLMTHLNS